MHLQTCHTRRRNTIFHIPRHKRNLSNKCFKRFPLVVAVVEWIQLAACCTRNVHAAAKPAPVVSHCATRPVRTVKETMPVLTRRFVKKRKGTEKRAGRVPTKQRRSSWSTAVSSFKDLPP
eukprot:28987-Pleurochrysis_carterae.AAC.2